VQNGRRATFSWPTLYLTIWALFQQPHKVTINIGSSFSQVNVKRQSKLPYLSITHAAVRSGVVALRILNRGAGSRWVMSFRLWSIFLRGNSASCPLKVRKPCGSQSQSGLGRKQEDVIADFLVVQFVTELCLTLLKEYFMALLSPANKDFPFFLFFVHEDVWGVAVAQWLRYCATNREVAGSIPAGVNGIFHWPNPSDCTMALR
jgi:hypothetical protein